VETTAEIMRFFIIELTCDRDHKTVSKEIRISAPNSSALESNPHSTWCVMRAVQWGVSAFLTRMATSTRPHGQARGSSLVVKT